MEELLVKVAEVVIPLVVTAILAFVSKKLNEFINAKLSAQQLAMAKDFAARAVLAAEQSGLAGYIAQEGQAKKEFAVNLVETWLLDNGVSLPVDTIVNLIEAAVFEYLTASKPQQIAPKG